MIQTTVTGEPLDVVGFENHGGQTSGVSKPFGKVLFGNGNVFEGAEEGYCEKNVIATYLHGPLLSKNPKLADHILRSCLQHHTGQPVVLQPLDDALENACHDILCARLLKKEHSSHPIAKNDKM